MVYLEARSTSQLYDAVIAASADTADGFRRLRTQEVNQDLLGHLRDAWAGAIAVHAGTAAADADGAAAGSADGGATSN